jgi:cellulose/xylan binding protein with CBM9 domain
MARFTVAHISLIGFVLSLLTSAAYAEPPTLHISRVSRAPRLEDFLKGTPREAGVRITDFRQREPGDGTSVSQETSAYLSYDDKNLYIVFVCKDEPGLVRAHLAKREEVLNDDRVAVYLDSFHDRQRAYVFSVNPLGVQLDGIKTEGLDEDFSFDTVWQSEGRLMPDGYIVSLAIPFKSLRFTDASTQTWGVALARFITRNSEVSFWPHITQRIQSFIQQYATLEGLEKISPSRNMQLSAYGAFTDARFLDHNSSIPVGFRNNKEARGG